MTTQNRPSEHARVSELLPWYAEGTLEAAEKAVADRHLADCAACRESLAEFQALAAAFQAQPQNLWQPSEAKFLDLLEQVDALEAQTAPSKPAAARLDRTGWRDRLGTWLRGTSSVPRWAFAAEGLVFAALALALVIPHFKEPPRSIPGTFETLTDGSEQAVPAGPKLHVAFAEDLTEGEMRRLLRAAGGRLVDGPSAIGVYTLALDGSRDPRAAAEILRAHAKVRLAEPMPGSGH